MPDHGEGRAATAADLGWPVAVATEPDGGFLLVDGQFGTVRRVAPDGTITTLASLLEDPAGVASTGDGGFVVSDAATVWRYPADGTY